MAIKPTPKDLGEVQNKEIELRGKITSKMFKDKPQALADLRKEKIVKEENVIAAEKKLWADNVDQLYQNKPKKGGRERKSKKSKKRRKCNSKYVRI